MQHNRPSQPTIEFSSRELASCAAKGVTPTKTESIVLLTYMTDFPKGDVPWVLGLSAALHGLPLVVVGHGMSWSGAVSVKIPAVRRAAQVLQLLQPQSTVAFVDGVDTAVINTPTRVTPLLTRFIPTTQRNRSVLFSGECGSWPVCYRTQFKQSSTFRTCLAESHTCYPNSGLYIGTPNALLRILSKLQWHLQAGSGVERLDDQAATNRLLIAETPGVLIDQQSELMLSLYGCKNPKLRTFMNNWTLCHEGAFDPLRRIRREADGSISYDGSIANNRTRRTYPLLAHASGIHSRLSKAFFGINQSSHRVGRDWQSLLLPTPYALRRAREHTVLLIDSATHGPCSTSTLGELGLV